MYSEESSTTEEHDPEHAPERREIRAELAASSRAGARGGPSQQRGKRGGLPSFSHPPADLVPSSNKFNCSTILELSSRLHSQGMRPPT